MIATQTPILVQKEINVYEIQQKRDSSAVSDGWILDERAFIFLGLAVSNIDTHV